MAQATKPQKAVAYTQMIEGSPSVFVTGFIWDGFGSYLSQYVYDEYIRNGRKPLTLYINSNGGILSEAFGFYDFVRAKGVTLNVEVIGSAGSAATIVALGAGRENINISENSDWFIHRVSFINEYGEVIEGNAEEAARLNALLVNAYMVATGRTEAEVVAWLDKGDAGQSMSATEAVEFGFASGIIPASKAAAFNQMIAQANKPETMTKVPVKLNLGKAIAAAFGGEVSAEVDVDAAVAQQLTEKDAEIAALKAQIGTLEEAAKPVEGTVDTAAITAELETAKAQNAEQATAIAAKETALADKDKAIEALNQKLADALKKPISGPAIANNTAAAVAAIPGETKDQNQSFVEQVFAQMTPTQKAQHEAKVKANAKKQNA